MSGVLSSQSKKTTYLLIICVAGLWGLIFYRVFQSTEVPDERVLDVPHQKAVYFNAIDHSKDTLKLTFDYRDPFMGALPKLAQENVQQQGSGISPQPAPSMPKVNWAEVRYSGFIANQKTSQKLVIMVLNGNELMLAEGETMKGLKLIKYTADSVKVKYQHETKYIRLK